MTAPGGFHSLAAGRGERRVVGKEGQILPHKLAVYLLALVPLSTSLVGFT